MLRRLNRCVICDELALSPCAMYCFKCREQLNERLRTERENARPQGSYVYAIGVKEDPDSVIKFGVAQSPKERLKELQTGSPVMLELLAFCPGRPHHETMIHRRLMGLRHHGEWFRRCDKSMEIVTQIAAGTVIEFLTRKPRIKDLQELQVVM